MCKGVDYQNAREEISVDLEEEVLIGVGGNAGIPGFVGLELYLFLSAFVWVALCREGTYTCTRHGKP
jgi:hypothetical protein